MTTTEAYLAGVLKGDGWCTKSIALRVADRDFSQAFADALNELGEKMRLVATVKPRLDERGYWLITVRNDTGKFNYLLDYTPTNPDEISAWLRGLFDSEGNASLNSRGGASYGRRIAMYSTRIETLQTAGSYLDSLGIPTNMTPMKSSAGHKGTKVVYELRVLSSQKNYAQFALLIGSSIARKRQVMDAIPGSYQVDFSAHCRSAQLLGAEAKHQKMLARNLPRVLEGIREQLQAGIKPTQKVCRLIPGFNSLSPYFRRTELIRMAQEPIDSITD